MYYGLGVKMSHEKVINLTNVFFKLALSLTEESDKMLEHIDRLPEEDEFEDETFKQYIASENPPEPKTEQNVPAGTTNMDDNDSLSYFVIGQLNHAVRSIELHIKKIKEDKSLKQSHKIQLISDLSDSMDKVLSILRNEGATEVQLASDYVGYLNSDELPASLDFEIKNQLFRIANGLKKKLLEQGYNLDAMDRPTIAPPKF